MRRACLLFLVLLLSSIPALPQRGAGHDVRRPAPPDPDAGGQTDARQMPPTSDREAANQRNKDRQAAIRKDADKLLALATELKQSVDRSGENTLSLDVVRKAEQIEKLAHKLKERMKD